MDVGGIRRKSLSGIVPELTEENYPYYRSIFAAECGSRLGAAYKKAWGYCMGV